MEIIPYNGNTLAYVGDAVMSLQVRNYLVGVKNIQKPKQFQKESVEFVSARAQAKFLQHMFTDEILSEDEIIVVKRGRNAKSDSVAKNASITTYRLATGLEALWGHLYLSEQHVRLEQLWQYIIKKSGE